MEPYLVSLWPPAKKYLKKLQKKDKLLYERFKEAIIDISKDPFIGEAKVGDLRGIYSRDIMFKGKHYEVAYRTVEDESNMLIVIVMCGTREDFYNNLKRYLRKCECAE